MAAAVAAAVVTGQPPAAAPASGTTVPVQTGTVGSVGGGRALAVVRSGLEVVDLAAGRVRAVTLPPGVQARRVVALTGASAAVIVDASRAAYLRRLGNGIGSAPAVSRLGPAEAAVSAADGGAWLIRAGTARQVDAAGHPTGMRVVLPAGGAVAGAVPGGLLVDTAGSQTPGEIVVASASGAHRVGTGRALAVAGARVLLRRAGRLGFVDLPDPAVHWLPRLSAVLPTGPAALSPDGRAFAVLAHTGRRQRLIVGPVAAAAGGEVTVLPLDGGSGPDGVVPAWSSPDTVLAARPDGRLVRYRLGAAAGVLLAPAPTTVRALSPG